MGKINSGKAILDAHNYAFDRGITMLTRKMEYDLFGISLISIYFTRKYKGIKKVILLDRNYFEPKETVLIYWEV